MERDRSLGRAVRAAGSVAELARRIGVARSTVARWRSIPVERRWDVARVTGVKPSLLKGRRAS
jgi:transposase